MSLNIATPDALVILLYLGLLIALGLARSRGSRSSPNEYILSGRRLSLPGFVATLVATWYGGILGVGENTFNYGIQTWVIFGLPYYFFAILFAVFLAGRIRRQEQLSIPDHFHRHYGRYPGILSAVFLLFLSSPAPYILSIGILLQFVFGISFGWALLAATVFSLVYIWFGGFGAVVRTDILQFVLMFAGFIILLIFAWIKIGSPLQVWQNLPVGHRDPSGGQSLQFILVWFFIALWTFVDPGFYQRCAAARSPAVARNGILAAVAFWLVFDLLTLFSGLYARTVLDGGPALFAFPRLGREILPPLYYGLFLTGIISTIMSTIDSLGLISAVTFGRDIVWRLKKQADPTQLSRYGLLLTALIALLLAWQLPSVVRLWYVLGSLLVPGLLLPFLLTFSRVRLQSTAALLLMAAPVIVAGGWYAAGDAGSYPLGLEPFYPGMFVSLLTAGIVGVTGRT
ncbi:MAG: sodium:solute symporter family protein [Candidatus Neomarinimicrobiota bacterium]